MRCSSRVKFIFLALGGIGFLFSLALLFLSGIMSGNGADGDTQAHSLHEPFMYMCVGSSLASALFCMIFIFVDHRERSRSNLFDDTFYDADAQVVTPGNSAV